MEIKIIHTPRSVIECFNNAMRVEIEQGLLAVKGLYKRDAQNRLWGDYFYDSIGEDGSGEFLVLKVRKEMRDNLKQYEGKLISVVGYLSRKVRKDSVIAVSLELMTLVRAEESKVSEDEKRFWEIQRIKTQKGRTDVSLLVKNCLFSNIKPKVALVWAATSCTRTEFSNALGNAPQSVEFSHLETSFGNIPQTIKVLKELDGNFDAVALIRGGGSGLDAFNDNNLLSTVASMKSAVISAVGHAEEKHNLKLIADLVIDTPTALGKFFSDVCEEVAAERAKSKAALVEEVRKQFAEQIETQTKQNKELQIRLTAVTEAQKKNNEEHAKQVETLQKQLTEITQKNGEKDKTNQEQVKKLTDEITKLNTQHKEQNDVANKQIAELQKQLGESSSKSTQQMQKLTEGFEVQSKSMIAQINNLRLENENRSKELQEKNREIAELSLRQGGGVSVAQVVMACVASAIAGFLLSLLV